MTDVDVVVVGAGVIGLAVARAAAQAGREVVVLEKEDAIGTGISSRNSEVIHAGIYYPNGSLKHRLCVRGRDLLYRYCDERDVPFRRTGKMIVATCAEELPALRSIYDRAMTNGVDDVVWLDEREAVHLEPALRCVGAVLSPSTGILDSHAYMRLLQADAERAGAVIAFRSPMIGADARGGTVRVQVGGADPTEISCRWLINCAGLAAVDVARTVLPLAQTTPRAWLCKGHYFVLRGAAPFRRLIYPAPEQAGLGVHLTLDFSGQARFGPDTLWVDDEDYTVPEDRAAGFYAAIRKYWPALPDGSLLPGYAGIRPKLSGPGVDSADFSIAGPRQHGVAGVIALAGIESPGLTASLAIAELVLQMVEG